MPTHDRKDVSFLLYYPTSVDIIAGVNCMAQGEDYIFGGKNAKNNEVKWQVMRREDLHHVPSSAWNHYFQNKLFFLAQLILYTRMYCICSAM
jgi:hypothetical protein